MICVRVAHSLTLRLTPIFMLNLPSADYLISDIEHLSKNGGQAVDQNEREGFVESEKEGVNNQEMDISQPAWKSIGRKKNEVVRSEEVVKVVEFGEKDEVVRFFE